MSCEKITVAEARKKEAIGKSVPVTRSLLKTVKYSYLLSAFLFLIVLAQGARAEISDFEIVKVYDAAPHSAFTDLIRFNDTFYITFRTGTGHIPGKQTGEGDGDIPILSSKDGKNWQLVASLTKKTFDLRDPKLSVTPDGRIMVLMGGSVYIDGKLTDKVPHVSFSDKDGKNFSPPQPLVIDPAIKNELDWIWRVTWHGNIGYGTGYGTADGGKEWVASLVKTTDGIYYDLVKKFDRPNKPNEATARFLSNDEMRIFLRCESGNGELGSASAPYTDWQWTDLGMRVGGPEMLVLPNGKLLFGHRVYEQSGVSTVLSVQDTDGKLRNIARFPSRGDTSYPGFVVHDGKLWASYYSSHEGKTSIYLAIVPLDKILDESKND